MLAGLSAIPRHFYEAAAIDGASAVRSFTHVTLPLLSPTLFFLTLIGVIGTFKAFNHIYIMRTAGAQDSVRRTFRGHFRSDIPVPQRRLRLGVGAYPVRCHHVADRAAEQAVGTTGLLRRLMKNRFQGKSLLTPALVCGGLIAAIPFIWMILESFMTRGETLRRVVLPQRIQWDNYVRAWSEEDFGLYSRIR